MAHQAGKRGGLPPDVPATTNYASALHKLGRSEEALPHYAASLAAAKDPAHAADATEGRALLLKDVGRFAEAAEEYTNAVHLALRAPAPTAGPRRPQARAAKLARSAVDAVGQLEGRGVAAGAEAR